MEGGEGTHDKTERVTEVALEARGVRGRSSEAPGGANYWASFFSKPTGTVAAETKRGSASSLVQCSAVQCSVACSDV